MVRGVQTFHRQRPWPCAGASTAAAPRWALRVLGARGLGHRRTVLPEQARSVARERVGASARLSGGCARVHGSHTQEVTHSHVRTNAHIECNAALMYARTCARTPCARLRSVHALGSTRQLRPEFFAKKYLGLTLL